MRTNASQLAMFFLPGIYALLSGEIMGMLRYTSNPQVEYIIRTMTKWETQN